MRGGLQDDWGGGLRVLEHRWKTQKLEFSCSALYDKPESSKQETVGASNKWILYNNIRHFY